MLPTLATSQVLNLSDAINKSGRQRMLSQRLAKAYIQIGMDIDADHSRKILDQSLATFDRQLVELRAFAPTGDSRAVLSDMEKVWLDYKQLLVGKASNPHDGKTVLNLSDEILHMADNVTRQLEKHAGGTAGKLVNLAGRERMLSQRMAKYYQAMQWGIAPANAAAMLDTARKEFVTALGTLNAASGANSRIKDELILAQSQWAFFDAALRQAGDAKTRRQFAANVATTSERILEAMDKVTGLYQQLA
ncbi:MAG: type IV pili methyl-accepting chemotaxis transducer N-terminal domain-containing protein [Burkholderiales bacterium]|nr:type IV pili methyl-accepting chemotaxis transducer N-terminal domain-containing protein [Burkholderiales bacterium]